MWWTPTYLVEDTGASSSGAPAPGYLLLRNTCSVTIARAMRPGSRSADPVPVGGSSGSAGPEAGNPSLKAEDVISARLQLGSCNRAAAAGKGSTDEKRIPYG